MENRKANSGTYNVIKIKSLGNYYCITVCGLFCKTVIVFAHIQTILHLILYYCHTYNVHVQYILYNIINYSTVAFPPKKLLTHGTIIQANLSFTIEWCHFWKRWCSLKRVSTVQGLYSQSMSLKTSIVEESILTLHWPSYYYFNCLLNYCDAHSLFGWSLQCPIINYILYVL